jgi:hypothetical protein
MRHLGSEVRLQQSHSMMDNAGEFGIAALFAVLKAEGPKSLGWSGRREPCHRIPPEHRMAPAFWSARTTRPLLILVPRYAADRFIVTAPPVVG